MGYLISISVIIFFLGSVSFMWPSKRSRHLAQLRLDAVKLGFKISSPAYGNISFKNKDPGLASYHLKNATNIKEAHFIKDKDDFILYSPSRLKYSNDYDDLLKSIRSLPESIIEIIFSKAVIAFLWDENLGIEELESINSNLKKL